MRHLISRKKPIYPVSDFFTEYLVRYGRTHDEGLRYEDLLRYTSAIPVYDEDGEDTLWSTVLYSHAEQVEVHEALLRSYAVLKAHGDMSITRHLQIEQIDMCVYGNTLPFRVRVVNRINENFDYFYVKKIDANRIYGLELQHILSPDRLNYFVYGDTIIEEHIVGIPADEFLKEAMPMTKFDKVRLAKEFVKFSERCFVTLLGDMHSGNFVIELTRDFEKWHFRIHPIDFDQQAHHGRMEVYRPYRFPQNEPFVQKVAKYLAPENVLQYRIEERSLIANRARVSHGRFDALMGVMQEDFISSGENVKALGEALARFHEKEEFRNCETMGEIVFLSITALNKQVNLKELFDE